MKSSSTEGAGNDTVNDVVITGNVESAAANDDDLTQLFPPTVVRAQLYREEPKLPRIPLEGAKLIGTASALFIKDLVERCSIAGMKDEFPTTDNGKNPSGKLFVQCADIYKLVEQTETFSFLKKQLDECGVPEMIQKERTGTHMMAEYQPPAKRKRAPTAASRTAKKVLQLQSMKQPSKNGLEETLSKGTGEQIIADDEDYD